MIDQGAWWTWAGSEPYGRGPVEDTTGEFCAANQPSDVWFLAGTFGGHVDRVCTVPAGAPIVFPILNMVSGQDDCDGFLASAEGTASVDGVPIRVHELTAPETVIELVDGNGVFGTGGTFEVMACGLWVASEPLPVGDHVVAFEGDSDGFVVSVTYALTVT